MSSTARGPGVPCSSSKERRLRSAQDQLLVVYAARHFRELSAQNELRPQDVMRILVHYHAYGDPEKVEALLAHHSARILRFIDTREADEVALIRAEYDAVAQSLARLEGSPGTEQPLVEVSKDGPASASKRSAGKQRVNFEAKITDRDRRIDEVRRRAAQDRADITAAGQELREIYADADVLAKHARLVTTAEIDDNEFNLNVPRYVDTFEPEPMLDVNDALRDFRATGDALANAERELMGLLTDAGYVTPT